jgi:tellurite resistance protein
MNQNEKSEQVKVQYLSYLPVALFGSVMGLTGLSLSWRLASQQFGVSILPSHIIGLIAMCAFVILTIAYSIKTVSSFEAVKSEFNHPIASNLFGTPLISILLLPILISDYNLALARGFWIAGTIGMTLFAWMIVSRWMSTRQQPAHATPAWIVPVVGMIDIPLAVPSLHFQSMHLVMIFALSVGLFFAIPLFTMILSRLMFEEPLPEGMKPILMILVAPFAVGFSAYFATFGQVDAFAQALYMLMLFIISILFGQLKNLLNCCPFKLSWWAVSFPLAASAAASIRYAMFAQTLLTNVIACVFLAIATLIILALFIRTLTGIFRGELQMLSN